MSHQSTMHLASGRDPVRKELQSLLTDDDVKPLVVAKRKGAGIALPPINSWCRPMGDSKHLWTHVNADNGPSLAQAFSRQPGNDAGSASDIEDAVSGPQFNVFKNKVGPGSEERPYQRLLIDLGKAQLGEELLFATWGLGIV
jgi:hypothetical protein